MNIVLASLQRLPRSLPIVLLTVCLAVPGLAPLPAQAQADQDEAVTADATIRFVHAVVGGPEVDVLLDGQLLAEAVPYGAATDYVPIAPGDRVLQVVPTGQPPDAAIVQQDLGAGPAGAYIFVALGPLNEVEGRIFDVNLDALTPGMARARLIDATHDTGALDLSITGGDELFTDVGFGDASDYAEVAPGVYSVDLRGEDDRVLGTIADIAINPSRAYDLLAIGQLADESVTLLTLETTVDPTCAEALSIMGTIDDSCIRLTHAAPDSAGIDVYVNDSVLAENLEYGTATEFVAVPAGEGRIFDVTATSAPIEEAIIEADFTLDAGQAYEILLTGAPDNLELTITGVDLRPVPEGQARLGAIHVSPDTGSVDIGFADGPTLFEGLEFRGVSEYIAVDEGNYALQVRPAEDQMIILESDLEVEAGTVYDVLLVGRSDNQSVDLVVLTAPVPLREGTAATPATNITATPAAGTVEPVATLDATEDDEEVAETVVAAEETATPVP
jgi:hypothetical protein